VQTTDVVVVGRIGAPYGVRGWVRVTSFTQPQENLVNYRGWLLETEAGWRTWSPLEVKPHKQGYVARFAEVADRDQAAELAGKDLAVARTELPDLEHGEYYWRDLEGLVVWNQGDRLGVVSHLLETGASPVLVIDNVDVGKDGADDGTMVHSGAQTLIPFIEQFVVAVDLEAQRICVDWDEAR
jgi:16S rRNA processing protein RimM